MRRDLTAWALAGAGVLVPIATHAAGLELVIRDIDGGPYHFIPPLWTLVWQPVVLIGLALGEKTFLAIGSILNALGGMALIFGSVVQAPPALIVPSHGLENVPRLEILLMHAAAVAIGAAWVALAARVGKRFSSADR